MDGTIEPILVFLGRPIAGNPAQFATERVLATLGLEWRVLSLEVAAEELETALEGLRCCGIRGVCVVSPLKTEYDVYSLVLDANADETSNAWTGSHAAKTVSERWVKADARIKSFGNLDEIPQFELRDRVVDCLERQRSANEQKSSVSPPSAETENDSIDGINGEASEGQAIDVEEAPSPELVVANVDGNEDASNASSATLKTSVVMQKAAGALKSAALTPVKRKNVKKTGELEALAPALASQPDDSDEPHAIDAGATAGDERLPRLYVWTDQEMDRDEIVEVIQSDRFGSSLPTIGFDREQPLQSNERILDLRDHPADVHPDDRALIEFDCEWLRTVLQTWIPDQSIPAEVIADAYEEYYAI